MKTSFGNGKTIPESVREPVLLHLPDPVLWINLRATSKNMATYRDNCAARTWRDSWPWRGILAALKRFTQRGDAVHTSTYNKLPVIDTRDDYITERYWGPNPPP